MASSSSTASSTSPLGECVCCGEETATRCSECAKYGTDWMFFCSREHQKLVWYLHKRVCGKRSNPFRWPGFTDKEIEDYMIRAKVASRGSEFPVPTSWIFEEGDRFLLPPQVQESAFKKRLSDLHDSQPFDTLATTENQKEIFYLRSTAVSHSLRQAKQNGEALGASERRIFYTYPLDFALYRLSRIQSLPPSFAYDPEFMPSWSRLQHRHLIKRAAAASFDRNPSMDGATCMTHASQEVQRLCHNEKMYNREGQNSTWFERFSNNPQARGKDPDKLFELMMEPYLDPGRGMRTSPESAAGIVTMRHTLWNTAAAIEHFNTGRTDKNEQNKEVVRRTGLPRRPIDFVAAALEGAIPGFASTLSDSPFASWSSHIMHLYMIYVAVAAVSMTDSSEEIGRYLNFTKERLISMITNVIPLSERGVRQGLLASLQHFPTQAGTT
ncbi:hypothetical protein JCM5353_004482 [Sporobolomyces roseus]